MIVVADDDIALGVTPDIVDSGNFFNGNDAVVLTDGAVVIDSMGVLAQVSETLRDAEVNILSLFCWPEKGHPGITQLLIRVSLQDEAKAIAALDARGFKVKNRYEKDITPFLPGRD